MSWEPVIGLEIHVQLKTRTKMFCRCEAGFGYGPNSRTCPVCLAHPGALPVPNAKAIEWTVKLGLALGCEVADVAVFHRKNYFYRDLPKGYQISQYDQPLCTGGNVLVPQLESDHRVGIVRVHLEEDAAKSNHVGGEGGRIGGAAYSLVDFNRGGTPLVEIVTQPDIHSAEDAKRFLQLLRQTVIELGVSDAEMEKGTLRVDANVSVRPAGSTELRTRAELKNMNSFNFIARGIEAEIERQVAVWESGGEVVQQTFDFDAKAGTLTPRRQKEEADDYRYFPEPDLVPVEPPRELLDRLRTELPELPGSRVNRFRELGATFSDALTLLEPAQYGALFERLVTRGIDGQTAASVIINDFRAGGLAPDVVLSNEDGVVAIVEAKSSLPRDVYREAVRRSAEADFAVEPFLAQVAVSDTSQLEPLVDRILEANPGQVAAYRGGKEGLLGFFVGQVMRETEGKANPKVVSDLVREKLGA